MKASSIAAAIANDFYDGKLDLSARGIKQASGWSNMPEVKAVCALRTSGHSKRVVWRFLTFVSAMDRARDSDKLWQDALRMFESEPSFFDPAYVSDVPSERLRDVLSGARVSQRHGADSKAWQTIARSLRAGDGAVARVVEHGTGDAKELLKDLHGYRCRYPLLRGQKIGPMWIRIMAAPGGAKVENVDKVPVAVDVQVRRATENLGVTDTGRLSMEKAKPIIRCAWKSAVDGARFGGPSEITGTRAALDPALWYFGKYGCSHCNSKKVNQPMPIGEACNSCQWTPGP